MHLSSFENCERLGSFCSSEIKTTFVIQSMDENQSQTEQHLSQLKASAFFSLSKIQLLRNATTYTWDWQHHLLGNRAILQPQSHRVIATELQPQSYSHRAIATKLYSYTNRTIVTKPQPQTHSYSHTYRAIATKEPAVIVECSTRVGSRLVCKQQIRVEVTYADKYASLVPHKIRP